MDPIWIFIQFMAVKFECKNTKTLKQCHVGHVLFTPLLNAGMGGEEKDVKALIALTSRVLFLHMNSCLHVFTEFSFPLI